jgi:hypothetical protein
MRQATRASARFRMEFYSEVAEWPPARVSGVGETTARTNAEAEGAESAG